MINSAEAATIDTADANAAAATSTATAPTTTKKGKRRRKSKFVRTTKGAVQKPSHPNRVRPQDRTIAAASSPRRSVTNSKLKQNSNDVKTKTIKRLKVSEQRLLCRLERTKEGIEEAVSEATSNVEHTVTVAYEKQLQKQQQEHSKIQSVTATQINKYKRMNDNLKDRNLKSRTTSNIRIATLKQNHRKEVSLVKKNNTKSINRVKSDAYYATKELEKQLLVLQEEQKKEEENKLEYERNKKQLARFGRQLNQLQKQKKRDTPKINKILIQSIETHRAMKDLSRSKNLAQKQVAAAETTAEQLSSYLSSVTNKFQIATQTNVELEIENSELKKRVAQLEAATPMPVVQKESNKLISARGGQKTFPFWLNGIILEQLVNNTPPSSINSNIFQ